MWVRIPVMTLVPLRKAVNHNYFVKSRENCTFCHTSQALDTKLGRYHDIIEYRDINLDTISILDGFGFNRNIDISIKCRDVFAS